MTILTDNIVKGVLKETKEQSRKTHLVLSYRSICKLGLLNSYKDFKVIDLRNNKICEIQNLEKITNMTHLYLQNNHVTKLSGFKALCSLKVLFLDFNKIEIIENLDNCPLKKLSIKGQQLDRRAMLGFDPLCIKNLKICLVELIASNNKLFTINGLGNLENLEILDISSNKIQQIDLLAKDVSSLKNLRQLNILNNPIIKDATCLAKVVSACKILEHLNGISINYQTRIYCENMYKPSAGKPKAFLKEQQYLAIAANKSSSNFPVSLRPHLTEKLLIEIRKKWKSQKKNMADSEYYKKL